MLKVFRDNLKSLSWILWLIIALFVLAIAVGFGTDIRQGAAGQHAATVGGQTVSLQEFQRQYRTLENQYRQTFGEQFTPELAKQMRLPLQALDQLINDKILLQEADRMGLTVSDEEVQRAILDIPAFKDEKGHFIGEKTYRELLQSNGYTVGEFEAAVRDDLLRDKVRSTLLASAYVTDDEVQKSYREQVERAKIRYVLLPMGRFAAEVQVSPAEVQSYFNAHKEEFRVPEQREAAYLLADTAQLTAQVKLGDADLRSYYDEHKTEFTQEEQVRARHILAMVNDKQSDEAARAKIEAARQRIQGGEDFAKVAQEVSEDPGSKANGGDLGFFGRNRMVKEFEDAAFGAQTGQIVGPVKSSFGYHLLQVTDRHPGGTQPFEQVKEQIRARLAAERVQTLAQDKANELARKLKDNAPKSAQDLKALAQQNPGVTFAESGRFGRQEPVSGLGFAPGFNAAAFDLKQGQVSDALQVPRGWAILYLTAVHEPRVPDLKEVEPRVQLAVTTDKEKKIALDRLRAAHGAGQTLDQIAAGLGVQAQETAEFGRQGAIPGLGASPELTQQAMALQKGQTGGPVITPSGAVLFEVTDRKTFDPTQFAAAREQTRATLQQEKAGRLLSSLVEQRRRELGVEYDSRLLESFGLNEPAQQG